MTLGIGLYTLKYIKSSKISNKILRLSGTKLDTRYEQIIP